MSDQCISTAESWLRENTTLGFHQRKAMSGLCHNSVTPLFFRYS